MPLDERVERPGDDRVAGLVLALRKVDVHAAAPAQAVEEGGIGVPRVLVEPLVQLTKSDEFGIGIVEEHEPVCGELT